MDSTNKKKVLKTDFFFKAIMQKGCWCYTSKNEFHIDEFELAV